MLPCNSEQQARDMNTNIYNNTNDIFHDSNKCKTKKTTSGTVETRGLQLKTAMGIAITVSQNCLSK